MKLVLIRHGESIANVNKHSYTTEPDHLVYLTERGRQQIHQTGQFLQKYIQNNVDLNKSRMWVSPLKRTSESAEILNSYLNLPVVRTDVRLVEQSFGVFDGVPKQYWKDIFPAYIVDYLENLREQKQGSYWARFPMGESPLDVAVRVKSFFETTFRDQQKHGVDTLFIVTHGVTLRVLTMEWMHYKPQWYENERNPKNGAVRLIERQQDRGYLFVPR